MKQLETLDMFNLDKRKEQDDTIAVFNYLVGYHVKDGAELFRKREQRTMGLITNSVGHQEKFPNSKS